MLLRHDKKEPEYPKTKPEKEEVKINKTMVCPVKDGLSKKRAITNEEEDKLHNLLLPFPPKPHTQSLSLSPSVLPTICCDFVSNVFFRTNQDFWTN
jgi:hypothetical protein